MSPACCRGTTQGCRTSSQRAGTARTASCFLSKSLGRSRREERKLNYGSAAGFESGSCPSMLPVTEVERVIIKTVKTMAVKALKHGVFKSTWKHITRGSVKQDVSRFKWYAFMTQKQNMTHYFKTCTGGWKGPLFWANYRGHLVAQQQTYLPLLALNFISCLSKYRSRERS